MDKKYQVFISSTFEDLQEERRRVIQTVLSFGSIPAGMEMFKAGNSEQWEVIKRRILECDYYFVILGDRYGSVDSEGKSFTEKEYDFAVENGIPVAAFLSDDSVRSPTPPNARVEELESRTKLERFRVKAKSNKMVAFWDSPDKLALECYAALHNLVRDWPRDGWVSAKHAVPEDLLANMNRLVTENNELRLEIDRLREKVQDDPEKIFLGWERKLRAIDFKFSHLRFTSHSGRINGRIIAELVSDQPKLCLSWFDMFFGDVDYIRHDFSESEVEYLAHPHISDALLAGSIPLIVGDGLDEEIAALALRKKYSVDLVDCNVGEFVFNLAALQIIQKSLQTSDLRGPRFELTNFGMKFVLYLQEKNRNNLRITES